MPNPMCSHPAERRDRRAGRSRHVRAWRVLAMVLVAVAVAGCRLDVDARVEVGDDGAGTVALTWRLDDELHRALTATGFELSPVSVPGWEVAEEPGTDGVVVTVSSTFTDPRQLQERVAQLQEGLDDEDPGLVESIDLAIADDGSSELAAVVGVHLPAAAGARGPGLVDRQTLTRLASDPTAFAATFTVVLPGPVESSNADRVDGAMAVWDLPVDDVVEATVTAGPPSLEEWVVPAVGIGLLGVAVLVGLAFLRRRRRLRRVAPHGRVERLQRWG